MERHIQADNAFIKWMETMSKNVVHIADAWQAAVKWADSHPQWIPVEEHPKVDMSCTLLVHYVDGTIDICDYYGDFYDYTGENVTRNVTHWMPLPAAPRKEGVEK